MASLSNICNRASSFMRVLSLQRCQTLSHTRSFKKSTLRRAIDLGESHKPSNFQKKILVWAGSYKTADEVPERVSTAQLKRAMDLFRIRVNIGMVLSAVALCALAMYLGRRLRDSGDTLSARGTAQQEEWARRGQLEREQKAKEAAEKK